MYQSDILAYLPDVYAEIREFKALSMAIMDDLKLMGEDVDDSYWNQFLYRMKRIGVEKWEGILDIIPNQTDTVEDRKTRIINKLSSRLPYTYRMLEYRLSEILGEGNFEITLENSLYVISIAYKQFKNKGTATDVLNLIDGMIPMNLVIKMFAKTEKQQTIYIGFAIKYRKNIIPQTYGLFKQFTLGTSKLDFGILG